MALPKVQINLTNGLGRVADTDDVVCGMVLGGITATGLAQNVGARVFGLAGAEALGITAATHAHAHGQLSTFFNVAGNVAIWILLVPDTTTHAAMVATNGPMDRLLAAANGAITLASYSIKRAGGYTPGALYFDYDIAAVGAAAQTLANRYATEFAPVRIVLEGSYLNGTKFDAGDALPTLAGVGDRVAVFCGAENTGDRHAAMGRLLGWYASHAVHVNPGQVDLGAFLGTGYLTTGVNVRSYALSQLGSVHDAKIMTLRYFVGKGGVYVTDDPSFAAATSDFTSLARGLVMDKAIRLTYLTYVEQVNSTIEITDDGKLSPTKVSALEDKIERALALRMTAEGNISSARAVIDPNQDVLATDKIVISVYIIPLGYLKEIVVNLQFENPAQ